MQLLMQVLIALQGFNPLLYAYRRSLRAVQEYIADNHVVRRTRQRCAYASLLVRWQSTGKRAQPGLVNTFHSLIKKRLIMMAKPPSHPARRVKYLLLLPAFAALMLLFSFRLVERFPATAAALRSAEYYAARLSQITVSAKAISRAEPSPFILFWALSWPVSSICPLPAATWPKYTFHLKNCRKPYNANRVFGTDSRSNNA